MPSTKEKKPKLRASENSKNALGDMQSRTADRPSSSTIKKTKKKTAKKKATRKKLGKKKTIRKVQTESDTRKGTQNAATKKKASRKRREPTMKVKGVDPMTGKAAESEIPAPEESFFEEMRNFDMSDSAIKRMIDRLDISADAKSLLYTFSKATIVIGDRIIKMGQKILDSVCHLVKEFPNATFGLIFGGIAGALISTIPILGQLLGPIVTPILMAFGVLGGSFLDLKDKLIERRIAMRVAEFAPLAEA